MTFPITPPPELIQQWLGEFFGCTVSGELADSERFLAARAAQWGADQELEACVRLLELSDKNARDFLYCARRPESQSLKEQALAELAEWENVMDIAPDSPIRRALEALPE
jgi:hypothetical protein